MPCAGATPLDARRGKTWHQLGGAEKQVAPTSDFKKASSWDLLELAEAVDLVESFGPGWRLAEMTDRPPSQPMAINVMATKSGEQMSQIGTLPPSKTLGPAAPVGRQRQLVRGWIGGSGSIGYPV